MSTDSLYCARCSREFGAESEIHVVMFCAIADPTPQKLKDVDSEELRRETDALLQLLAITSAVDAERQVCDRRVLHFCAECHAVWLANPGGALLPRRPAPFVCACCQNTVQIGVGDLVLVIVKGGLTLAGAGSAEISGKEIQAELQRLQTQVDHPAATDDRLSGVSGIWSFHLCARCHGTWQDDPCGGP